MSGEKRENALQIAILEWQKKYGVQDGDPLLAALELFQIHLSSFTPFSFFEEFRDSIELLESHSKTFSKQAAEVSEALHAVPNLKQQLEGYHATAYVLVAFLALAAGILIGKFLF